MSPSKTEKQKYHDALDDALDRPVAYNPAFKRITGSTVAGVFLSQAWYWSKRHREKEGWFWKSQKEWEEETGLTRSEQETARKHCLRVGVIEEKLKGVPATMHYRVNKSMVYELLGIQSAEIPQTENDQTQQTKNDQNPQTEIEQIPQASFPANSQNAEKQQSDIRSNLNKESETSSRISSEREGPSLDFKNMTVSQARQVPALRMYARATEFFPGSILWEYVDGFIREHQLTEKQIRDAAIAWAGKGYKPSNVQGILEWARDGIPANGNTSKPAAGPAIDENAVEATRKMLEEKYDGKPFAPPPPGLRPQLAVKQLAQQKGLRK